MLRLDPMGRLHAARSADDGRSELVALIAAISGLRRGGAAPRKSGASPSALIHPVSFLAISSSKLGAARPRTGESNIRLTSKRLGAIASELDAGRPEKALRIVHLHHHKRGHLHDN